VQLTNIYNSKRRVYLFCRDATGTQQVIVDDTFYPFFYEIDPNGKYTGYDGTKLKKVIVNEPSEIRKYRSNTSYSSDIPYTKNYLIHRMNKLTLCPIKHLFIDIEVLCPELPTHENPIYTISCISAYNSLYGTIQTWYLADFKDESALLLAFAKYIYSEKPDLILGWNMENFDYPYLYFRYKKVLKRDFAKDISPIHEARFCKIENMMLPAGISILDYLLMFKKVHMREASYALDHIAQKHLGEASVGKFTFMKLTEEIRKKNIQDVNRMVKLEAMYKIIPYFNEIRLLSKALWEDLCFNSYIIEMLLFEEAKHKRVVLPNSPPRGEFPDSTFKGAIRECLENGALFDIGKFDLTSAYPNMVRNFCLDPQNIVAEKTEDTITINEINWAQNKDSLLPSLIDKLLVLKDTLKQHLKKQESNSSAQKTAQIKYDAIKGVVNSAFGVMGFPSFRIFNNNVASTIAFLVRDLLMYVKDEIVKDGYEVVYYDTDSVFIKTKLNICTQLNALVQRWAKEKYGKEEISVEFEYEGYFEKVFLLTRCRYYGYLITAKGSKIEIKGMEIKRSSSSKFEALFQKNLIEKILNKDGKEEICEWIKEEKERLKTLNLAHISFPCKIANKVYKNKTIFVRAYENTQKQYPQIKIEKGELFYYTYVSPKNVLAFTDETEEVLKNEKIDYPEITRRNIDMKLVPIFEAMSWELPSNQFNLFTDKEVMKRGKKRKTEDSCNWEKEKEEEITF